MTSSDATLLDFKAALRMLKAGIKLWNDKGDDKCTKNTWILHQQEENGAILSEPGLPPRLVSALASYRRMYERRDGAWAALHSKVQSTTCLEAEPFSKALVEGPFNLLPRLAADGKVKYVGYCFLCNKQFSMGGVRSHFSPKKMDKLHQRKPVEDPFMSLGSESSHPMGVVDREQARAKAVKFLTGLRLEKDAISGILSDEFLSLISEAPMKPVSPSYAAVEATKYSKLIKKTVARAVRGGMPATLFMDCGSLGRREGKPGIMVGMMKVACQPAVPILVESFSSDTTKATKKFILRLVRSAGFSGVDDPNFVGLMADGAPEVTAACDELDIPHKRLICLSHCVHNSLDHLLADMSVSTILTIPSSSSHGSSSSIQWYNLKDLARGFSSVLHHERFGSSFFAEFHVPPSTLTFSETRWGHACPGLIFLATKWDEVSSWANGLRDTGEDSASLLSFIDLLGALRLKICLKHLRPLLETYQTFIEISQEDEVCSPQILGTLTEIANTLSSNFFQLFATKRSREVPLRICRTPFELLPAGSDRASLSTGTRFSFRRAAGSLRGLAQTLNFMQFATEFHLKTIKSHIDDDAEMLRAWGIRMQLMVGKTLKLGPQPVTATPESFEKWQTAVIKGYMNLKTTEHLYEKCKVVSWDMPSTRLHQYVEMALSLTPSSACVDRVFSILQTSVPHDTITDKGIHERVWLDCIPVSLQPLIDKAIESIAPEGGGGEESWESEEGEEGEESEESEEEGEVPCMSDLEYLFKEEGGVVTLSVLGKKYQKKYRLREFIPDCTQAKRVWAMHLMEEAEGEVHIVGVKRRLARGKMPAKRTKK